jgi:hypothetical protein
LDRRKGSGGISVEGGGLIIAAAMPAGFLGISKLILVTPLIMLDYCRKDYWELFLCVKSVINNWKTCPCWMEEVKEISKVRPEASLN